MPSKKPVNSNKWQHLQVKASTKEALVQAIICQWHNAVLARAASQSLGAL